MVSPAQQAMIARYAARIEAAGHGGKGKLVAELAAELGVSRPHVYRLLDAHVIRDRSRRSDAGELCLTREDAVTVSTAWCEGYSNHGKQRIKLTHLVEQLRFNGMIRAERVDPTTGEIVPLSDSAIARALRAYQLHPEQLRTPTPHVRLSSPHPNYCWQVDASVCVVFYLPNGGHGICELKDGVHYKNKPENLKAIEAFRVIRYVLTDHNSNTIRWRYYPHSESGQHTVRFMAWAMARKKDDPFHGAPFYLMVDPGATAANLVKRFCRRLEIELIVNKPGNARAKGSVEKAQDIVETYFESGLKFYTKARLANFDDLNALAELVQQDFNATKVHTRHGRTRYAQWMQIRPEQLRVTATEDVLLSLATEEPLHPKVQGDMTVQFKGRTWNVLDVPGVTRGAQMQVHWHPFLAQAMAVIDDAQGRETHIPLPEITKNADGFPSHAIEIATDYRALPDTALETNRKEVLRRAAGDAPIREAEAVRKGRGFVPFGGQFDPHKAAREATPVTYLPRAGTELDIQTPVVQGRRLSATQAALELKDRLGDAWKPEFFEWLSRRHPDGVTEDQLDWLAEQCSPDQPRRQQAAC